MDKLEKKYGNIHTLMGILINEIKFLHIVRKNDFKGFENLSCRVNEFHDRLTIMNRQNDAENSYILKEIEGKLCYERHQKLLESQADEVDYRTVESLVKWLNQQTHLRRITYNSLPRNSQSYIPDSLGDRKKPFFSSSASTQNCLKCTSDYILPECSEYVKLYLNGR